jgi:hypothetical protein
MYRRPLLAGDLLFGRTPNNLHVFSGDEFPDVMADQLARRVSEQFTFGLIYLSNHALRIDFVTGDGAVNHVVFLWVDSSVTWHCIRCQTSPA